MNNNQKATKRALLTSVMALVMCVVMLVGTTFAWFTDTASTGVNKIVSGNLKVDIIGANSDSHIEKLDFTKATGAEGENLLWEPGCRYLTVGFRIANKGNLALKWKAQVNMDNITNGKVEGSTIAKDGKSLLDVIDFYVVTSTDENAEAVAIEKFTGNLAKGAESGVYYIKGVMQTTAGNDYQDLTLEGITITVYATQDTVENDSFNNQYDKDAQYPDVDVVTVTPDTIPSPFRANTAYFFEAGNYGDQHFVITDKENVTLIGKTGAKFDSLQISSIDYVNPSIGQEVDLDNSTLTVKGFEVAKTLMIVEADKNVVVEDNTAAQITVKANLSSQSIAVNNNIITGGANAANGYGVYIVPNVTDYDLTVTGNSFTNVKSHAISVQGCGDGSAVTAAKSITVTGNTFTSYGTNNKTGRAAFKIWEDTKLAPNGTDPLNEAAKALAKTVKENNSFAAGLGENCVVADFYGKTVAFTNP